MTRPEEGPEWADEAHLDEVFSTWVPGPPESASAAEKEMAGEPAIEIPAEETISDHDMEAALAAALAEAEGAPAPTEPPAAPVEPAGAGHVSEPAGPSWLQIPTPDPPPGPGPVPAGGTTLVPEAEAEPELEAEALPEVEPEPQFFEPEPQAFEPEPAPAPMEPDSEAFDPAPPPPPEEPARPARPWTRSDDDILPARRGKGRRR